jgi:hypothetical protein
MYATEYSFKFPSSWVPRAVAVHKMTAKRAIQQYHAWRRPSGPKDKYVS